MKSSQLREGDQVARYFDENARSFDSIYGTDKSTLRRWRDRLTRGTVLQRLEFVNDLASRNRLGPVLDVGCGGGRFALRLAPRVSKIVGIDFAPEMIALAQRMAAEAGLGDKCTFHAVDFLTWDPGETFDMALAIGVVDYVSDPQPLLAKLASVSGGSVVVSFPRRWHALVPLRWARLRANRCPVFFYDRRQVEGLGRASLERYRIEKLGRDYMLVGNL